MHHVDRYVAPSSRVRLVVQFALLLAGVACTDATRPDTALVPPRPKLAIENSTYCFTHNDSATMLSPSGCPVGAGGFQGQSVQFSFDMPRRTRPTIADTNKLPVPERRIWATYEIHMDPYATPIQFRLIGFGSILQAPDTAHASHAFEIQLPAGVKGILLLGLQGWCPASYQNPECWEYARGRNAQNQSYTHGEFAYCLYNEAARDTSDPLAVYSAAGVCDGTPLETPLPPLRPSVTIEGPGSFPSGEIHTWTATLTGQVPGATYRWLMGPAGLSVEESYAEATEVGHGLSWTGSITCCSSLWVEVRDAAQQLVASDYHYVAPYLYSGGGSSPSMSIGGPTSVQPGSSCTWSAGTKTITEPHTVVWSVSSGGPFMQVHQGSTYTHDAWPGSLTIRATARRSDGSQITSKDQAVAVTSDAPEC